MTKQEILVLQSEMLITHRFFLRFYKSRISYAQMVYSVCGEIGLQSEAGAIMGALDTLNDPKRGMESILGLYLSGYKPNKLNHPLVNTKRYTRASIANGMSKLSRQDVLPVQFFRTDWESLLAYHEKIKTLIDVERILNGI